MRRTDPTDRDPESLQATPLAGRLAVLIAVGLALAVGLAVAVWLGGLGSGTPQPEVPNPMLSASTP